MFRFDKNTRVSGIIDNCHRGNVGDFLREKIQSGSTLLIVCAYFTIYAYEALKEQFDKIGHLQFLFDEPKFVKSIDPNETDKKPTRLKIKSCDWQISFNKVGLLGSAPNGLRRMRSGLTPHYVLTGSIG